MREPYVLQGAHQRFLIDARLFLGKNFPSPPLTYDVRPAQGLRVGSDSDGAALGRAHLGSGYAPGRSTSRPAVCRTCSKRCGAGWRGGLAKLAWRAGMEARRAGVEGWRGGLTMRADVLA